MKKKEFANRGGWSLKNWFLLYDIPRSTGYKMIKEGHGPKVSYLPGTSKPLVTVEADAEWRASLNESAA
jgi:hypothetical protein